MILVLWIGSAVITGIVLVVLHSLPEDQSWPH
jgi:hypothetical protein